MVTIHKISLCYLAGLAFIFSISGCSSGEKFNRVPIEGAVTLDGKPIQSASFAMVPPVDTSGNNPSVHGMVVDGHYQIPKARGPVAGVHRVDVTIFGSSAPTQPGGDAGSSTKELGTYSIEIQVPENGSQTLNFEFVSSSRPTGTA